MVVKTAHNRPEFSPHPCIDERTALTDTEAYLAMRAKPEPFDERPNAPVRRLAHSTLQQQKTHIRLAPSVLVEGGMPVEAVTSRRSGSAGRATDFW